MNQTENILEFHKVKENWAEYAFTEAAKAQILEMKPYLEELKLEASLRETRESTQMVSIFGNPPAVSMNGLETLVEAAAKGDCLGASELLFISQSLAAVSRLKRYLERGKERQISLAFREENLHALEDLRQIIELQIAGDGVADQASKLLKNLRSAISVAEGKMREKAESVIRANKECMSDQFCTTRNGRICVPVKKEYKFRIQGIVIDKSATGNTLFVEPTTSAKYFEELQELRLSEENEVRRILYELTAMVDMYGTELKENIRTVEKLDFVFSKGKFAVSYDGVEPQFTREHRIILKEARHPLMSKDVCVPLDFSLGDGISGIVITGPNTGGKTVALKNVALTSMMAQCGLFVPCKKAELCMNSNVLCDIGDGQNLSENLSTFSAHITNIMQILGQVTSESLVVLDELGSGTDPLEGMGIAVAILEKLKESGALFLVTTHYPEVKVYAEQTEGILNARMDFDKENLKPLYRMVIGEAGESCAFYIARRLGMPADMLLRAAKAAYGEESEQVRAQERLIKSEQEKRLQEETTKYVERQEKAKGEYQQKPPCIQHKKTVQKQVQKFHRGDSVMVYPDKKIGIVCEPEDEKGVLLVQLKKKKLHISHKRVKLLVAATELYPADYDFSIIFDTVENRKKRHEMQRKYTELVIESEE